MTARLAIGLPLMVSAIALSGCMGSPTYGTNKTQNAQLVSDVTTMFSLTPKEKEAINYAPRAELVKPAADGAAVLPAPQDSVVTASNGAWPESPEQRRLRIRAEATANRDKPGYRAPVVPDMMPSVEEPVDVASLTPEQQRAEFKRRQQETMQGSATTRKYLSEPPLDYRVSEATAPTGDVGTPEWRKERSAKRAARKKGSGGVLGGLWPF